jgi:hypothetical protein
MKYRGAFGYRASGLLGLLALSSCVWAQESTIATAVDRFTIEFPSAAKMEKKQTPWGGVQLTSTVYSCVKDTALYQVTSTALPREALQNRSASEILSAARDGTQTMQRLRVEAEQELLIDSYPARRFMVQVPDGPLIVHLLVLAEGSLYHVLAVLPRDNVLEGVSFVRSFRARAR